MDIVDTAVYDAFGKVLGDIDTGTAQAETSPDPVGFGGQFGYYTDAETGLVCLTHRYYDGKAGRFVNRDPIGYKGGMNLYGFCGNNPVNMSDPSGFSPVGDAASVVGLVPGPVGMAANLVSAVDSAAEGDYVGAGLSVLGEIPALGELATGAKIARAAYRLRKAEKAAVEGKTFITYVIKNEKKEVVYVGKTHGAGTPRQVLNTRMRRGHDHYFPEQGDTADVIAQQSNKHANAGAEDVWYEYHRINGANLRNSNAPLDFGRRSRRIKSIRNIKAYSDDLRMP